MEHLHLIAQSLSAVISKQTPNHVFMLEGRVAATLEIVAINALYLAIFPNKITKQLP